MAWEEQDLESGDTNDERASIGSLSTAADEGSLPRKNARMPARERIGLFRQYMRMDVDTRRSDVIMIGCCFIAGLIDSVSFNTWGCFVSMQTGNTIFVGLAASSQPVNATPYSWARSLIAMSSFLCGAFVFSRTCRFFGPLHRGTLMSSFAVQSLLIFVPAAIVQSRVVHDKPQASSNNIKWPEVLPLGLLSFGMAGQIVASRLLGMNEVPTVVLTSVYTDLISDVNLVAPLTHNVKRNRRALAVTALLAGSIIGGWMTRTVGMAPVLWMTAGMKAIMALSWVFWKKTL